MPDIKENTTYTFQEIKEVWYKSLIDGATLWQYCQDTKKTLPVDFVQITDLLFANINDPISLKTLLDNSAVMCGLADEYLMNKDIKEPTTSVADTPENTSDSN